MKKRLSIAGTLVVICFLFGIAVTALIGGFLIPQKYQSSLDEVINRNLSLIRANQGLQFAMFFGDKPYLQNFVLTAVDSAEIDYVFVNDISGGTLAEAFSIPGLTQQAIDAGVEAGNVQDTGRRRFSLNGKYYLDVIVPVYAAINPVATPKDSNAYHLAFQNYPITKSRHFVGSYQLGINLDAVQNQLIAYVKEVLTLLAICLGVFVLSVAYIVRRVTRPFTRLAEFAEDISSGRLDKPLRIRGAGEVSKLVSSLNTVLEELRKHKSQVDVDNKLLSMKVAERTEQLTSRNVELSQAVKEISKAESRLKQLAYFDSLTSLPNRQLFLERLAELVTESQESGALLGLLYMDLDNFKRINDSLGHSVGDQLLQAVAIRMANCLRSDDFLAIFGVEGEDKTPGISRLGGDEFTIILKDIEHPDDAAKIAQRILEALKAPFLVDSNELVVTPSIGIAISPQDSSRAEELVKMADIAMYQAKKAGKNSFTFYSEEMTTASVYQLQIEADLRKAIANKELMLYFQPQVDTTDGTIVGAEALARWEHPDKGFIPPCDFIPLAEETGIIHELGFWVIRHACQQLEEMQQLGLDVPVVSVNVSPLQITQSFTEDVAAILEQVAIEPGMLRLELTESALMRQEDYVVDCLFKLKERGIKLAIDDFGTGYSSLSYLTRFPIDELKIDRSFVITLDEPGNSASRSLIDAIVAMANSMELDVVAEGVDSPGQLAYLQAKGVNIIQGYLFSKPMQFEEFVLFLEDNPFPKNLLKMSRAAAK